MSTTQLFGLVVCGLILVYVALIAQIIDKKKKSQDRKVETTTSLEGEK